MKKLFCSVIIISLLLTSVSIAFAKQGMQQDKEQGKHEQQVNHEQQFKNEPQVKEDAEQPEAVSGSSIQIPLQKKSEQAKENQAVKKEEKQQEKTTAKAENKGQVVKASKQTFKIEGSPVIKFGKYKLPIRPLTKGIGADVKFDKASGTLTVTKGDTTIVINFKDKTVTVNGVADTDTKIFTAGNSKKMTVLVKYIANTLGVRVTVDKNKVTVTHEEDSDDDTETGSVSGSAITPVTDSSATAVSGAAVTTN